MPDMKERPLQRPVLKTASEVLMGKKVTNYSNTSEGEVQELVADNIHEQYAAFAETDADKRPDLPAANGFTPDEMTFEEYSEYLSCAYKMKKKDGIVEAMAYTPGEETWVWCMTAHGYLNKMFQLVGNDRDAEVLIWHSYGPNFTGYIGAPDGQRDTSKPYTLMPEKDYIWRVYERMYHDGTHNIENQINIDIPTIGIWQGGGFHSEIAMLCDITIATEDAWTTEQHFRVNMVPGDGIQTCWRRLMGDKRFAYAELTGEIITAKKALEYGMINEIVPTKEDAIKRAYEIADLIMHSGTRQTRRLTIQYIRQRWKEAFAQELRPWFAAEMWNSISEESPHHPLYWEIPKAQAKAVLEAEKKGKIVKPRLGPFIEEDDPRRK